MNGAEALLRTLVAGGVDLCFANPGTSEMHIMDAGDRVPAMRFIPCLFEGVAIGAADGYARMSGRPAATLLHLGPGLANGLANLHNAGKAHVPLVSLVGEHPAYHRSRSTPLGSDLEAIARPFSQWLRTAHSAETIGRDTAEAIAAAEAMRGVATLAVPSDVAWSEGAAVGPLKGSAPPASTAGSRIGHAIDLLKSGLPTALVLGGEALYGPGLETAGRLAAATGAVLTAPFPLTRLERGAGRPAVTRLPYPRAAAAEQLSRFRNFIFVGADIPYAYFVHPDDDGTLLPDGAKTCIAAAPTENIDEALHRLAEAFPPPTHSTIVEAAVPTAPAGPITPDGIAGVIAATLPDNAIVIDEGMTCGRPIMAACRQAAPHDWLGNTGGSIGIALPLATGAALAAPGRPVLCLSADGSALYTPQALWTMARENLAVTVVIFANNAYALLKMEHARIAAGRSGSGVPELFDIARPCIDWVAIATGFGMAARRVGSLEELTDALGRGFADRGPNLIEVPL